MDLLTDLLKFTSASDSLLFTDQGKRPEELEEHSYESRTYRSLSMGFAINDKPNEQPRNSSKSFSKLIEGLFMPKISSRYKVLANLFSKLKRKCYVHYHVFFNALDQMHKKGITLSPNVSPTRKAKIDHMSHGCSKLVVITELLFYKYIYTNAKSSVFVLLKTVAAIRKIARNLVEKAARNNEKIQLREFFFRARELHRLALRIEIMLTSVNNIRDIVAKGSVNKMLKLFAIEQLKSFAKRIKNYHVKNEYPVDLNADKVYEKRIPYNKSSNNKQSNDFNHVTKITNNVINNYNNKLNTFDNITNTNDAINYSNLTPSYPNNTPNSIYSQYATHNKQFEQTQIPSYLHHHLTHSVTSFISPIKSPSQYIYHILPFQAYSTYSSHFPPYIPPILNSSPLSKTMSAYYLAIKREQHTKTLSPIRICKSIQLVLTDSSLKPYCYSSMLTAYSIRSQVVYSPIINTFTKYLKPHLRTKLYPDVLSHNLVYDIGDKSKLFMDFNSGLDKDTTYYTASRFVYDRQSNGVMMDNQLQMYHIISRLQYRGIDTSGRSSKASIIGQLEDLSKMDYVSERTKSKNEVSYRTIVEERSSRGLLTSENSMELSGRESYNSRYEANYGFGAEAVHFKNSLVREKEFFKDRREESDKVSAMETGKLGGNFFKHKKKEETKVAYDGPGVKLMSSSGNSLANKLNRFSCSSGQKAVQNASYDRISFPKNKNDLWCRPEKDINVREVINRRENYNYGLGVLPRPLNAQRKTGIKLSRP